MVVWGISLLRIISWRVKLNVVDLFVDMTENNSEFAQEPEVGSSAGDNSIVEEHPSEDSVAKLNLTYVSSLT